jgi:hypothetical protein
MFLKYENKHRNFLSWSPNQAIKCVFRTRDHVRQIVTLKFIFRLVDNEITDLG